MHIWQFIPTHVTLACSSIQLSLKFCVELNDEDSKEVLDKYRMTGKTTVMYLQHPSTLQPDIQEKFSFYVLIGV
jgi:hypothetical protein